MHHRRKKENCSVIFENSCIRSNCWRFLKAGDKFRKSPLSSNRGLNGPVLLFRFGKSCDVEHGNSMRFDASPHFRDDAA